MQFGTLKIMMAEQLRVETEMSQVSEAGEMLGAGQDGCGNQGRHWVRGLTEVGKEV